ncbi:MAG: endopeptidase La [Polyangiaceae bacterium UTPRO1]|nr:endopeptidase La [Myxococcales bacterium]OQY66306.1 MAG: endopeptidase La [Polyangiaceae bacterium UTPRO1]
MSGEAFDPEKSTSEPGEQKFFGFEEDVSGIHVPSELPVLPLRGVVVFPSAIAPLLISRDTSLKLVEDALNGERMLALVAQKNAESESPGTDGLYSRGTAGRILKMLKYPDGSVRILVQGLRRIEIQRYTRREPYFVAQIRVLTEVGETSAEIESAQTHMVQQFSKFVSMIPYLPDELQVVVNNIKDPSKVTDLIASNLNVSLEEKQDLLNTLELRARVEKLGTILDREIELLELGHKIQSQVQTELNKNQKEFYLRQQMKAIQRELGEGDSRSAELDELRQKIADARMPEEARKAADNELERLRIIPPESAEHTVVRTYLEWLVAMPWATSTEDNLDIPHARKVLDADHFDLDKVKDRILEYLAVRKLRKDPKGPILCFVGPPGVGKTSLGRSIAKAMERKFVRISLGGVRDEAEIRGHRRTYIGSLPGRIIQSLRTAGSNNPMIMLDEIDKLGGDFRGDPASALLEVLDPEQNHAFVDHYLDVPVDLSKVMWVTTANYLDPIPPALLDRMEVLELSGYIEEEKLEISWRHLIPKQIRENGLSDVHIAFTDDGLLKIIRGYTREAGLRNLEREIGRVCRKVARQVTEGRTELITVSPEKVREFLGPERFFAEIAERSGEPGVATGLAYTPNGGDILFIESTKMGGKKGLTLTGHLGEVMKESAQAALSYIRARADRLGIAPDFFENCDLHIHVPAGAVPKDGPSAGVTIATSLASLLTGRPVKHALAMTGEITLRGKVMPVGGIKEKVLAAKRAGISTVVLPRLNEKDLEDIPETVRREMQFRFVDTIAEALDFALEPAGVAAHNVEPARAANL